MYVNKQQRLHRRLFPGGPERHLIKELIKQMPAGIRATLTVGQYDNVEHFRQTAQEVLNLFACSEKKKPGGKLPPSCGDVSAAVRCFGLKH